MNAWEAEGAEHNPLINALATLNVTIAGLSKRVADAAARDEARLRNEPTNIPLYGSPLLGGSNDNPVVPATGPLLLTLGGPETGNRWVVKRLWVSDAGDATATVAGAAYFFVGQAVPPSGNLATWVPVPASSGRWIFPNLPNATTFTSDALVIKATDQLLCVIKGGTATQTLIVQGEAINESLATPVYTVT